MNTRSRRRPVVILTAVALVAGVALIGASLWNLAPRTGEHSAAAERRAVTSAADRIVDADASPPVSVEIPVIDFTAPVLPQSTEGATVLNPPTAGDAYWLQDYGVPGVGTQNTVYLIGHSSADGRAVFDPLVDRAQQRSTLLPGDEIIVHTETGSVLYELIATERYEQQELARLDRVWSNAPGRLVIITCFFATEGDTASDNMVVFARQRSAV